MISFTINAQEYHGAKEKNAKFDKKVDECLSLFFKKEEDKKVIGKEKTQLILNCRLGNFAK